MWTGETLTIDLDDIDRQVDWLLKVRVRGARAGGAPNPDLLFFVDGVLVLTHPSRVDYEEVQVPVPSRPAQPGLAISMRASSTFVPGPSDPRALGVMLDSLTLTPSAVVLPPRRALGGVALASAALGAAVAPARRDRGLDLRHRDPAERRTRRAGGSRVRAIPGLRRRRGANDDLDRCRDRAPRRRRATAPRRALQEHGEVRDCL